ncbi:TolC family protein [Geoalkalibacter halelectricus]|uniref:TolC family protein n=1 Tax=Geoalkalibacter halelectricus TaxID=2847045 RepID=UPI003D204456
MKRARLFWFSLMFLGALLLPAQPAPAAALTIGVVVDGPWEGNQQVLELFRREIEVLVGREFPLAFPAEKLHIGDWRVSSIRRAIDQLLTDPQVDVVLAMGVIASHELSTRGPLPKPAIAPFIIDQKMQGVARRNDASGVPNLSYIAVPPPTERDLRVFHDLSPFSHLAVLHNRPFVEAIPGLEANYADLARELGVRLTLVAVDDDAAEALQRLPAGVDAVYVAPLLRLAPGEFSQLVRGLKARGLPSFSLRGRPEVERGLLAGIAMDDFPQRARRTALNLQRILLGEKPADLAVGLVPGERLVINMDTARDIGFYPSWRFLTEAELLFEDGRPRGMLQSLAGVAREALKANLDLAAASQTLIAGEHQVAQARAALLPQAWVGAEALIIDRDRAASSFGNQAQRTLSATARLRQSLYSETAWAGFESAEYLQQAREEEVKVVRLDVIAEAVRAYLGVLRAQTVRRIEGQNLELTRTNLELARVRSSVGISGPEEVYRWESQIATDRQRVIAAEVNEDLARLALNRLLQRPAETPFQLEELRLDAQELLVGRPEVFRYVDNPWDFKIFRDFMVREGLARAPELERFDAAIAAERRQQAAARRAFHVPELTLQADLSHRLAEGGVGQNPPGGDLPLPQEDDTRWSLALNLNLPLTTGGARRAELGRTTAEVARLQLERAAFAQRLEELIRARLLASRGSFAGIHLSRAAADAAHNNLEMVKDAYSRGVVSIVDLLDAQSSARVADLVAANAVYDFLFDFNEVERATGIFFFLESVGEQQDLLARLQDFFAAAAPRIE